jgi:hypothetical protein
VAIPSIVDPFYLDNPSLHCIPPQHLTGHDRGPDMGEQAADALRAVLHELSGEVSA